MTGRGRRRRLTTIAGAVTTAIVVVATLAVVAFAIPLGIVIDREFDQSALLHLERAAIVAERELPAEGIGPAVGPTDGFARAPDGIRFGLYDRNGVLVAGAGPPTGDRLVRLALTEQFGDDQDEGRFVVTVPVLQSGQVTGVLRAEAPGDLTARRIHAAWASMALLAIVVLAASAGLARRVALRIARPVEDLQRAAASIGLSGDPTLKSSRISELDDVAVALLAASARLTDFVVVRTIEYLRDHGYRAVGLNFAAMRAVLAGELKDSSWTRLRRKALRQLGDSMQIESLWRFNAKYDPAWTPRYLVVDGVDHMVSASLAVASAESLWELPVIGRFFRPCGMRGDAISDTSADRAAGAGTSTRSDHRSPDA